MCEETTTEEAVEPKKFTSDSLVYIARDGDYGDAVGMFLLDPQTLGEDGLEQLNAVVEAGEDLWTWIYRKTSAGHDFGQELHLITSNGFIMDKRFNESIVRFVTANKIVLPSEAS